MDWDDVPYGLGPEPMADDAPGCVVKALWIMLGLYALFLCSTMLSW